jgi:hypothetical protein
MSRTSHRGTLLLAAAGLLLATAAPSPAQTTLRWKFEQGDVLNQSIEQVMKMSMKLGEQDIATSVAQTIDVVWTVGEVAPDGTAQVTQETARVRMKMAGGAGGFEYDSAGNEEPAGIGAMLAPALGALAKSRSTMKMTPRGDLEDVKVSQETIDAMKAIPFAGQMGGMFSEEGLVNMIKQGAQKLPEEAVEKGAAWTGASELDMPPLGKLATQTTYTYAGPEEVDAKTLQRIEMTVSMQFTPPQEQGQAQIAVKDQKADGVLYFDNAAGRVSHSTVNQKMTMEITVAGNTIEQKIDQTTTIRLTPAQKQASAEK